MINVYKCTLNARERFYLVLQSLGNVMRLPQRSIRIHDNVKFDEVVLLQGHWSAAVQNRTCEGSLRTGPLCVIRCNEAAGDNVSMDESVGTDEDERVVRLTW